MEEEKITPQKAREILEKENTQILRKCKEEIDEVLNKYSCQLDVAMVVTRSGNYPQIDIISKN